MGAYGRITPALPLKELNRSLFITADFGQVLDHIRFRKLRMFLTIHGSIFHDEVGHWLGNPRTKVKICVIYILPKINQKSYSQGTRPQAERMHAIIRRIHKGD